MAGTLHTVERNGNKMFMTVTGKWQETCQLVVTHFTYIPIASDRGKLPFVANLSSKNSKHFHESTAFVITTKRTGFFPLDDTISDCCIQAKDPSRSACRTKSVCIIPQRTAHAGSAWHSIWRRNKYIFEFKSGHQQEHIRLSTQQDFNEMTAIFKEQRAAQHRNSQKLSTSLVGHKLSKTLKIGYDIKIQNNRRLGKPGKTKLPKRSLFSALRFCSQIRHKKELTAWRRPFLRPIPHKCQAVAARAPEKCARNCSLLFTKTATAFSRNATFSLVHKLLQTVQQMLSFPVWTALNWWLIVLFELRILSG